MPTHIAIPPYRRPQLQLFHGAAGHRLPGHLLVQVVLDEVVMLDELPKLLIGVIAAAAWKVHIVEYGLACSYG